MRPPLWATLFFSIGAVGSASLLSQSTSPPVPTFRAEVEYVEVDALVTDEQGRVVSDLQKEDFRVFEDGRPQTIANFGFVKIPVEMGGRLDAIEPDVVTNERPFAGRIYTLILDDLHTAPSRAPLVKSAARQFIERHLAANDLMAIVRTAGRSGDSQDFTGSKRLLLEAVDTFMGVKLESAAVSRNEEYFRGTGANGRAISDPFDTERGFNARTTTRTLRQAAEWLGGIRGRRKTILFISEGIDYDITDPFNNRSASAVLDEMREAIAAATRSNVSIYSVDPRGLTAMAGEAIETGIFAEQLPRTYQGDTDNPSQPQARSGIGLGSLRTELQLSQDSLRTLATETNGLAAVNASDFRSAFERIVDDNSAYYVLAYYPNPNRRDGKFHRIEVRTSRSDVTVRARRGYVAPRGSPPKQRATSETGTSPIVTRALNSPLPSTGVAMRMFAAPFKGDTRDASVVVGLELSGSHLTLEGSKRVELSYAAVDASGQTRSSTEYFTPAPAPEAKARIEKNGIRIIKRLDLPPGRYQLRVAAHDVARGNVGSLNYDLEIPDYSMMTLGMSGILLTSREGVSTPTARGDALLERVMPAPPVSQRTFARDDEILLYAEIYDRSPGSPHTVDVVTTVTSADGTVVFEHSDERSSTELQGASGAYGHTARVPMSPFNAGHYVLKLEARSRIGHAVSRQVAFEVR